mgnify:CR=1 FL=1
MVSTGKLELRMVWDGETVRGIEVKSVRPKAYQLLHGRTPDNAVQFVPMLFSVCGKAQHAAAMAAVAAAQQRELPQADALERRVTCEAMQEHLWRLLLDWPKLLGQKLEQEQFVRWHGELNGVAAGHGDAAGLLAELPRVLLGMPLEEWWRLGSYGKLEAWWRGGNGLLAPLFAALAQREDEMEFAAVNAPCELLPQQTAVVVQEIYAGHLDQEFAAMPHHEGWPMETGALTNWHGLPLLQEVLRERPCRLFARLLARLADLLRAAEVLVHGNGQARIDAVAVGKHAGLALVRTARGMLLHHVRIEMGRVAKYLIVAPTEWNFHPRGALASGLEGLKGRDAERLMNIARAHVLSLDPCVEYGIEIAHA